MMTAAIPKAETTRNAKKNVPPWVSLLSGATAGAVEATITYPFEFAKTRAQLRSQQGATALPKNPLTLIYQVAKVEGPAALYTGCSTLVVGTAVKAGVRFLSFDSIKNLLSDENGSLSTGRGILAGMCAGATESVLAVTPTERIKTALIDDAKSATRRFKSSLHATRILIQENGLTNLYKGGVSTTMKQMATSAVRMGSYNFLKETSQRYDVPKTAVTTFGMGALAGTITVYATQPFDVVKTRSQSVQGAPFKEAVSGIYQDYGPRGFWKGSTMRLGRLILSGGIVFSVYEQVAAVLMGVKEEP
ncbi:mitochondrial carrier domain-containing protein [Talaromyces proteolyticus]|uniref:Mitochondrial carrier domain-containing protein n=1 Tax=Talaromyces proteolyticus TaxID=1131652 RepID=A0AAD4PRP8_9EURO|nr:mitochondrial carrier domain-containing protein [Talaromyces proteolyticus]KAH8689384.1 mitochondrial carrier domain-containing protein [Talaromyces proteolyticus]